MFVEAIFKEILDSAEMESNIGDEFSENKTFETTFLTELYSDQSKFIRLTDLKRSDDDDANFQGTK